MKRNFLKLLVSVFALFIIGNVNAQAPFKYLTYIFPPDSLKGFDEAQANKDALNNGYFGPEYHVFMYTVKRNFINQKFDNAFLEIKNELDKNNGHFEKVFLELSEEKKKGWFSKLKG